MNDKLLVETAVLAGEIMLVSGAEIYRVEDTINRILRTSRRQTAEAIVFSTGIFATLNDAEIEAITVARRVTGRSSNLNRVYLVNHVSRQFCGGMMDLDEAYARLREIGVENQYRPWMKNTGIVGVAVFFALLLGGGTADCVGAAAVGSVLAFLNGILERLHLNDFCKNAAGSFVIALTALIYQSVIWPAVQSDIIIVSAIMPLLPGVIFTTAIRDTLNGDYASGAARIMEAAVIALAVAAGVGGGMALFRWMAGGGFW